MATRKGTTGNDVLRGTAGKDTLHGMAGDDQLYGNSGHDDLYGGNGRDLLHGGDGWDHLFGGAGADHLDGGNGDDHLQGNDGDDVLVGGAGRDGMFGGDGDDLMLCTDLGDNAYGNADDDTLILQLGTDVDVAAQLRDFGRRPGFDGGGGLDTFVIRNQSYFSTEDGPIKSWTEISVDPNGRGVLSFGSDSFPSLWISLHNFEKLVIETDGAWYKGSEVDMTVVMDGHNGTMSDGAGDETLFGRAGSQVFRLNSGGDDTVISGKDDGFGDLIHIDGDGSDMVYAGNDRVLGFDASDRLVIRTAPTSVTYTDDSTIFTIDDGTLTVDAVLRQVSGTDWMV